MTDDSKTVARYAVDATHEAFGASSNRRSHSISRLERTFRAGTPTQDLELERHLHMKSNG